MKRRDFFKERPFYTALAEIIEEGTLKEDVHGMIIPGGRTLMPLYQRLFQHGLKIPTDFRFVLSDERHCATKSPESNQGSILPFLKRAGAEVHQVIVPDVDLPPEESASKFNEDIEFFMGNGGSIDVAILGVGSDGHTAGIFEQGPSKETKYSCVYQRPDGMTGITCSPELIMSARRMIFVLRGATKQDIVEKMMSDPTSTVAGRMGDEHADSEIWFCLE